MIAEARGHRALAAAELATRVTRAQRRLAQITDRFPTVDPRRG